MRTWLSWFLAGLLLAPLAVSAAATADPDLVLVPDAAGAAPAVAVTGRAAASLTVEFTLPALAWSEATDPGVPPRALAIAGGGHVAGPGGTLLPTFTRLVALPPGTALRARVLAASAHELPGLRLPADAAVAAKAAVPAAAGPRVLVGAPARLRDLVVAPVTFVPVSCDAAGGAVSAASRLTVALEFVPDAAAPAAGPRRAVPESFDRLYREYVLDYDSLGLEPVPGSYLVICPNNAQLIADLQPLLDWRRRQGYAVTLATLAQTGGTAALIKDYIKNAYGSSDPPLEFVTLVGDADGTYAVPTWFESLSGYNGEGDHYYTTLAGDDVLADVHIGRLSITSVGAGSDLQRIVSKCVTYESSPPLAPDPGWFTRGSVTGDPTTPSGIAPVLVSQWAKAQMLARGYTEVDSCFGGSFASTMLGFLNRGSTLFTYRGYLGMSGFTTTYIANSTNGFELPFAVILTCDTGSFEGATSRSEAFLRAANGGAIGAIGTATIGTHTRYNDCMFHGIVNAVLNSDEHRLGPSLTRGKLEMYNNYYLAEPTRVEIWSVWNNLMGDPATECWTSALQPLSVTHPAQLAVGSDAVPVTVLSGGLPLAGARVAVAKAGEVRSVGVTDAAGTVNLPLAPHTAGALLVTVQGHAHRPYLGSLALGAPVDQVSLAAVALDDDAVAPSAGNGDGLAGPGETLELAATLRNLGTATATSVQATLVTADPYVTVLQSAAAAADLTAGAQDVAAPAFVVQIAPGAPDGHVARCDLTVSSAAGTWTSLVEVAVRAPALAVAGVAFGGPGGSADPGEAGTLTVTLRNSGSLALAGATATLLSDNPWLGVTDEAGAYGAIPVNGTAGNGADTFAIGVSTDCFRGHLAAFTLLLEFAGGGADTVAVTLPVGTATTADPVGPDRYGYYAFDNLDTSYPEVPVYQWVEIDPGLGGAGATVGLTDYGDAQDDTRQVALPFPFLYYGRLYDHISVCSNGWFAFGSTNVRMFRNFTIPSAGSPDALVAVFWDNLRLQASAGGVFTWHDAANHRFVIEWSRLQNDWNGSVETFQAILFDPAYHPTDTGDGAILMQYHTVANVDDDNGFATVGVQNPARDDGVLCTYWNAYAAGAGSLVAGRAIRFVPVKPIDPGYVAGAVHNVTAGGAPVPGAEIRIVERDRILLTMGDGTFAGSVPPGTYTFAVSHPSFAPDTLAGVAIEVGETTTIAFDLDDVAGPAYAGTTSLASTDDTVGPYVVESVITDFSPPAAPRFFYTTSQGGGTHELPLALVDPGAGRWRAEIPGQPMGSWVQYWLEATDAGGNVSREPAGAPWQVYEFGVGSVTLVLDDDFETNLGWTTNIAGDTATSGIWTRVDPNGVWNLGTLVSPEDDATPDPGVTCWITGNDPVGSAQGADDVDGGHTTLLSPQVSLAGFNRATVSYRRWYTNDTGNNPGADTWRVEVSNNGSTWTSLESTTASDRSWSLRTFEVNEHVALTSTMRFRFVAEDQSPGSVVEAGVDDFLLTGFPDPVDAQGPVVALAAPDGGETLPGGSHTPVTVSWSVADNVGVVHTALVLSRDDGASWPDTLVAGPLDTTWAWPLPAETAPACRLKVVCWDSRGNAGEDASAGTFAIVQVSGVGDAPDAPAALALDAPRPNPFNPATELRFALPAAGRAAVRIYDAAGRRVATLIDGELGAGAHAVTWRGARDDGAAVPSGAYFCRLETPQGVRVRKLALVK